MKRVFVFVILLAMTLSLFAGCQEAYDPDKLYTELPSEQVCKEIFHAMLDQGTYANGLTYEAIYGDAAVNYEWYYGTINGYIVIFGSFSQLDSTGLLKVADYRFEFLFPFHLYVYKDGEVLELQESYKQGLLTKKQIGKIHEKHEKFYEEYLMLKKEMEGA